MDAESWKTQRTLSELASLGWGEQAASGADQPREALDYSCRIGDWWFLVPLDLRAEVSPVLHCARLPFTRAWCLGLANDRGELVPVYDLGALIETNARRGTSGYFLMLGQREARAGLWIDEIKTIRLPPESGFSPLFSMPNLPEIDLNGINLDGTLHAKVDFIALLGLLAQRASLIEIGPPSP